MSVVTPTKQRSCPGLFEVLDKVHTFKSDHAIMKGALRDGDVEKVDTANNRKPTTPRCLSPMKAGQYQGGIWLLCKV